MSPSWRDRVHIALTPGRVILIRFGRGLHRQVRDKAIVPCAEPAAGEPPWQPAVIALQQALATPRWRQGEARVILSNHFVRYQMIDWDASLTGYEEQLALVRYRFTQTFGDEAAAWDYRWNEGRPPAPCLVCAIDHALYLALRELFTDAGLHLPLTALQPYLMAAFNHWRHELDGARDWFVLAEPERLCLAWFATDEWAGLHSQQVGAEWARDLPLILERAQLLAGLTRSPERLCIHAPETPEIAIAPSEGWATRLLRLEACPGFTPGLDAAYAMAMNP